MNPSLSIIVDVSGSMNEMGKIHLQRNLCRYAAQLRGVDQEKYADLDIRFYQWAHDIFEIALQSDGDIPVLNAEGSSSLNVLSDFLSQNLNNTEKRRAIILSDGNFDRNEYEAFLKWKTDKNKIMLTTVAVGGDANLLKLKKISTNNSVHISENISSAIDRTIFGSDESFVAPISTIQILQSEPAEIEELGEGWDA